MYTREGTNIKKTSNTSVLEVGCVCGAFILILGLAAGFIAYLIFGIMYLVKDYNVANDCKGSSLWEYVLVALILSFSRLNAKNTKDENGIFNFCVLILLGLIETGLAIWGGFELFNNSCDDLADTNLWKFGFATFAIQTFVATVCLIIIPLLVICCEYCCNYEKKEMSNIDTANLV